MFYELKARCETCILKGVETRLDLDPFLYLKLDLW